MNVRNSMNARVISVALDRPPRPRLLPYRIVGREHRFPCLWTMYIPPCPCSHNVIRLHDRLVHVVKEFMTEAGAVKGRDLRLGVRRMRSRAYRDRYGNVV
jgi:hypothetical protein